MLSLLNILDWWWYKKLYVMCCLEDVYHFFFIFFASFLDGKRHKAAWDNRKFSCVPLAWHSKKKQRKKKVGKIKKWKRKGEQMCVNLSFCLWLYDYEMCFIYHCLPFHDERLYCLSLSLIVGDVAFSVCAMNVEEDREIKGTGRVYREP